MFGINVLNLLIHLCGQKNAYAIRDDFISIQCICFWDNWYDTIEISNCYIASLNLPLGTAVSYYGNYCPEARFMLIFV